MQLHWSHIVTAWANTPSVGAQHDEQRALQLPQRIQNMLLLQAKWSQTNQEIGRATAAEGTNRSREGVAALQLHVVNEARTAVGVNNCTPATTINVLKMRGVACCTPVR
jgi:hypothetical protein